MCAARPPEASFSSEDLERFSVLSCDFLAIVGADGNFKGVNPVFEQGLGWSAADLVTQPFTEFLHGEDRAVAEAGMVKCWADGQPTRFDSRFRTCDGGWRWLSWHIAGVQTAGVQAAGVQAAGADQNLYCMARDITERKAVEDRWQRLNAELEARVQRRTTQIRRYAEAIEKMQDGFYLWQLENLADARSFRLLVANPAAEQLTGVSNAGVIGKTMLEGFPPLFETELPETYRQIILTGQEQDLGDVDYAAPSEEASTYAVKAFPLADQCLGVLFEDVTERRGIQRRLGEQREQLKVIFERAGVGIARLTLDGQWLQANDKLCDILGYPLAELLQTDFQSITYADDAAADQTYYRALLSGELETAALDKRYVRKNGELVWCNVKASIIRDQQQRPCYFIAFIEDIRDRKNYEQTLEQQTEELSKANRLLAQTMTDLEKRNQELDEFAYVVSHDLKAPLRAIANLATWLEEDLQEKLQADNQHQFELLQRRVQRMENLIDGLLAYSRAGRGQKKVEQVDLGQLLNNIIDLLAPPAEFTIDIPPQLPSLQANRAALTRVLSNLISNAIKHHHQSSGRIEIRCQVLDQPYVELSIRDDGPGIAPAYHNKVFNIFQVLQARDKVENTGIGLAIVKKTVEAEGGKIFLDSKVGQGTTFRFTWPHQA